MEDKKYESAEETKLLEPDDLESLSAGGTLPAVFLSASGRLQILETAIYSDRFYVIMFPLNITALP